MRSINARTILGYALLAAWVTLAASLWPLPPQKANFFVADTNVLLAQMPGIDCDKPNGRFDESRCYLQGFVNDPSKVEAHFWFEWVVDFLFMALGIGASLMMRRGMRFWGIAVLLTSLTYLWRHKFPVTVYQLLFSYLESWDHFVARLGIYAKYPTTSLMMLYYDVLMPLLLITACVLAIRSYKQRRPA